MNFLGRILANYILVSTILSWFLAQVIKTVLTFFSTKKLNWERMFGAGGMPSAHSASVCALAMGIARVCGVESPEFALAVAFAAVVIYDAMGVRRAAGEQARILNKMVHTYQPEIADKDLKEYLGHTPMEVLAGMLLGIIIALAIG